MTWQDIGDTIGDVAPLVATAIAGPAGGAVAKGLASLFDSDNNPKAISKIIANTPNAFEMIKQYESRNRQMLEQLNLQSEMAHLEDRQSARSREVDVRKSGNSNNVQAALGVLGVLAFFLAAGFVIVYGIKDMDQTQTLLVGTVIGGLLAIAKDIYGYYFGTSKSDEETKQEMTKAFSVKP